MFQLRSLNLVIPCFSPPVKSKKPLLCICTYILTGYGGVSHALSRSVKKGGRKFSENACVYFGNRFFKSGRNISINYWFIYIYKLFSYSLSLKYDHKKRYRTDSVADSKIIYKRSLSTPNISIKNLVMFWPIKNNL